MATSPYAPGKMPRFEQIGNLYRCRDAEMAKEVMMVVVVRFESWLGLSLVPSFENIYIYFFTCCGSSCGLYSDSKEETERVESGNRFVACRYRFERPSNRIK